VRGAEVFNAAAGLDEHLLGHGEDDSEKVWDVEAFAGKAEYRLVTDKGLDNLEIVLEVWE